MAADTTKDVQKNIHFLDFRTQLILELGCKAFNMSTGKFISRLIRKFWVDYEKEVTDKVPREVRDRIETRLLNKFEE